MNRQAFSRRLNYAMADVREASGIARQFFQVLLAIELNAVTAVTINVGAFSRTYLVTDDRSWCEAMFRDARDGAFGPPNHPCGISGGIPPGG